MSDPEQLTLSWLDRFLISVAPDYGLRRVRARASASLMSRHYEAAQVGRRTSGWQKYATDANTANGPALTALRELSRDLRRNNGWAKRAIQAIVNNTVGWGIMPKAKARPNHASGRAKAALLLWNDWADSTLCDFDGRLNFYGLQRLAMETIVESGEVLIVRQPAPEDLPIPMRLQVLEPDYLDMSRNGIATAEGGTIIGGVEFDSQGRRVAYWLYTAHPGGQGLMTTRFESVRVPAERVLHVYRVDRPGQVRGVPWLAAAITRLKDLDDFEDAELMQQKVAACFSAFVTDMDGQMPNIGKPNATNDRLERLGPGQIQYLKPGQSVTFANPPRAQDGSFSTRNLRRIAVSIGVTYEDLSGDLSQVNFSSARIGRLAHWQNVSEWREHMLIPQLCNGVWEWAMQLTAALEGWPSMPSAQWSAPPMPILEPDKEGTAYQRLVRIGAMTFPQMVRELGYDPIEQLEEIKTFNAELDKRGIILDIDPRKMSSGGQPAQPEASAAADDEDDAGDPAAKDVVDPADDADDDGELAAD